MVHRNDCKLIKVWCTGVIANWSNDDAQEWLQIDATTMYRNLIKLLCTGMIAIRWNYDAQNFFVTRWNYDVQEWLQIDKTMMQRNNYKLIKLWYTGMMANW